MVSTITEAVSSYPMCACDVYSQYSCLVAGCRTVSCVLCFTLVSIAGRSFLPLQARLWLVSRFAFPTGGVGAAAPTIACGGHWHLAIDKYTRTT